MEISYSDQLYKLTKLPVISIEEDILNQEMFTENDIESLSEDIRENGFIGVIIVYPISSNKYRIESGHRRYEAAVQAEMTDIPVYITSPPGSELERRERLSRWNLHGRNFTPMEQARRCDFQFRLYQMKKKEWKQSDNTVSMPPILQLVSRDLDISTSNVTKYKMLLNLIPELQKMADSGSYSWAMLAKASVLTEVQQKQLYQRILGQCRLTGPSAASGKWIEEQVNNMKKYSGSTAYETQRNMYEKYVMPYAPKKEDPKPAKEDSEPKRLSSGKRFRRKDTYKGIRRSKDLLYRALANDAFVKEHQKEETVSYLKEMKNLIEKTLKNME